MGGTVLYAPKGPPWSGFPAHCRHEYHCLYSRLTAKAVAVLLPILGTSWVFGVLAVSDRALVFQYMFAVLNSLQVRRANRPIGRQHCRLPPSLLGMNTKAQLRWILVSSA